MADASLIQVKQLLLIGVSAVLIVASAVGSLLKAKVAHGRPHRGIDNLNSRIQAWWVMVLLLSVALLSGRAITLLMFCALSFIALREYTTLVYTRPSDHSGLLLAFYLVLPLQYVLVG